MQSVLRTATLSAPTPLLRRLVVLSVVAFLGTGCLLAGDNDEPAPGYLGIYMQKLTGQLRKALDLKEKEGVLVSHVLKDSPAEEAGLEEGDVIVEYHGDRLDSPRDLRERVRDTSLGESVNLRILRDGDELILPVVIGERPNDQHFYAFFDDDGPGHWEHFAYPHDESYKFVRRHSANLGVVVTGLNADLAAYFDVKEDQGVLVLEVLPNSAAEEAGLKAGDVITKIDGSKVASADDLRDAVGDLESEEEFRISIVRHGKNQRLDAELDTSTRGSTPNTGWLSPPLDGLPPFRWMRPPLEDDLRDEIDRLRKELKELRQELKGLREDI
jgi:serine protease Do